MYPKRNIGALHHGIKRILEGINVGEGSLVFCTESSYMNMKVGEGALVFCT